MSPSILGTFRRTDDVFHFHLGAQAETMLLTTSGLDSGRQGFATLIVRYPRVAADLVLTVAIAASKLGLHPAITCKANGRNNLMSVEWRIRPAHAELLLDIAPQFVLEKLGNLILEDKVELVASGRALVPTDYVTALRYCLRKWRHFCLAIGRPDLQGKTELVWSTNLTSLAELPPERAFRF